MTKAPSSARPPSTRNGTGEKLSGVISVPLMVGGVRGLTNPHTLLRRIANTIRPSPLDDSATPTMSRLRAPLGDREPRGICPRNSRMMDHDDGLGGEHVAPGDFVVTQPPMSGPAAIAMAATPPSSA